MASILLQGDQIVGSIVEWIDSAESLPDSDVIVLVHVPDCCEPVWLGYHDGESWLSLSGFPLAGEVTHWAEMPTPPISEGGAE